MSGGSVQLAPWQRWGLARLRELLLDGEGWAVLGDSPGLGKTRTSASVVSSLRAEGLCSRVIVVAPPATLEQWRAELSLWGLGDVVLLSHGMLRRRQPLLPVGGLLLVDEAHHFRNPRTVGYRRLSLVSARSSRVLLLTATPVHNRAGDALALMELCGQSTEGLKDPVSCFRARMVRHRSADVRRHWPEEAAGFGGPMLRVARHRSEVLVGGGLIGAVCAFCQAHHAAFRAAPGALERILLQRLLSSPSALRATLARLGRFLRRSEELGERGRGLDARTWRRLFEGDHDGEGTQEWLSFVLDEAVGELGDGDPALGLSAAREGLERLLGGVRDGPGQVDAELERTMRAESNASRPVLVFTEYRDTARALWRTPPCGMRLGFLTASEGAFPGDAVRSSALVASDLLTALSPGRLGGAAMAGEGYGSSGAGGSQLCLGVEGQLESGARERTEGRPLDGLVLTGGWCEGINLPGVELVVHWDLPATPARVVQRTGRVQRTGTARVEEWLRVPSGKMAEKLRVLERLERKRRLSLAVTDGTGLAASMPGDDDVAVGVGAGVLAEAEGWVTGSLAAVLRTGCHAEAGIWLRLRGVLRSRVSRSHAHLRESVLCGWRDRRGGFSGDVVDALRLLVILECEGGRRGRSWNLSAVS